MEINPILALQLRQAFKYGNRFMLWMWRLGLAKFINLSPETIGRIMVLTHVGRKTGAVRKTPVNYCIVNNDIYCTAGFGSISDWYRNILKNPQVEVWLPEGWWQGKAEDVSHHPDRVELLRQVLIASGFAARSVGLQPKTMTGEEIEAATSDYKLIRIRRTAACTGAGGPGDLAWIWPAATFLLLPLALRRRR
jgi:deazaflavin-dependent oxidoreductase (nitroreductase family)